MSSFEARVDPLLSERRGLGRLPFVGREVELRRLRQIVARARTGTGAVVLVAGDSGIGKTRFVETMVDETRSQGWAHAAGHAYAVERGCPYGVIAEAVSSIVHRLDAGAIAVAARGTEGELARILPSLGTARRAAESYGDTDAKTRLHWHFAQFLRRLAAKAPLLVTLDNLQWCDDSSLELLHFVSRQLEGSPLLIVATYHPGESELLSASGRVIHSLTQEGLAHLLTLAPLPEGDIVELVKRGFDASGRTVEDFARRLNTQTRGHPFFTEEVLKALVERGALRWVDGSWAGWHADVAHLPTSVRDAVQIRLGDLPESVRSVAGVLAVVGTPASLPLLMRVSGLSVRALADIMDQLIGRGILVERRDENEVLYDFAHPMVRSVLYEGLGSARAKSHHVDVAAGMESLYGNDALGHAAELAPHLEQGADLVENDRAVEYFMAAGRDALERHADREAERFLSLALDIVDRSATTRFEAAVPGLLATLARARQRLGDVASVVRLLVRALDLARSSGDVSTQAGLERRLGLAALLSGGHSNAVEHFREAERLAMDAGLPDLAVRSRIAHATALQSVGRLADAKTLLLEVLPLAEQLGSEGLLARVHRAMVLLYVWAGPAEEARKHGAASLRYAEASGDSGTAWSVHWSLALLASFTGDSAGVRRHQQVAERLARSINSPFLLASAAEIGIEYASAAGHWTEGLDQADEVIPIARAVAPRTLLPRLLVWTGLIQLERGELDRAKVLMDEAWELSGAGRVSEDHLDVNVVLPAYTGMAAYHVKLKNYQQAVEYGERGLAIADRLGNAAWAIHRLLPILCEASLWQQAYDRTMEIAQRLRAQSAPLQHRLGLAWADAAEALVLRLRDHHPDAARRLLTAADRLEEVPFIFHAARLRRNAAQLLAEDGAREAAIRELRSAHDVFLRLGALHELQGAREELRELGVRPPQKTLVSGGVLTKGTINHGCNFKSATRLWISRRWICGTFDN